MEQGSLRCDVNTSLNLPGRRSGAPAPRPRTSTRCARSSGRCARRCIRQAGVLDAGGRIIQETRHFHEDTGDTTLGPHARRRRPTTATSPSPTWCRSRPDAGVGRASCRPRCPSCPGAPRSRLQERVGPLRPRHAVDAQRRRGRADRGDRRRRRHRRRRPASGGWASWPAAPTRPASSWPTLGVTPAQVAELQELVDAGKLNDKLARAGARGRARRRGRRRPRSMAARGPGGRLRHRRADRRRRRGDRRQPGRRREDPRAARSPRPARWSARS